MVNEETSIHPTVEPAAAYVLVVEDKIENYVTLSRLLAFAGVRHTEWKSTGSGVIQFAEMLGRPLDLILLDLSLPHESGYDLLPKIRGVERFQGTRVVAVTGSATIEEMRKTQRVGFDGFLGKPLRVERFPDQLARILRGEPVWEHQ
jgi:two-component system, cell cycle response regulator DivK